MSLLESGEQRYIKAIIIYHIVQELCESRGGRPGLSVLISLTVSVDVKQHFNQEDTKLDFTTTIIRHLLLASMNLSRGVRSEEESCSLTLEMSLG